MAIKRKVVSLWVERERERARERERERESERERERAREGLWSNGWEK